MKFKDGDKVEYPTVDFNKGYGFIRGQVSVDQPIYGAKWILEHIPSPNSGNNIPNEAYPFKFFTLSEVFLTKV